jgi:hypothetical protein
LRDPLGTARASPITVPPTPVVRVPMDVVLFGGDVQQSAQPAPVRMIRQPVFILPQEVLVVQRIVGVELVKIVGEVTW